MTDMTDFKTLLARRRSHRVFSHREIDADDVQTILRAALMAPSSMNRRSWHFVVIDDAMDLEKLADAKEHGSQLIKGAPLAIAVLGDPLENDCWIEDGSIAAFAMQCQAEELGLGSCWVQMYRRGLNDGTTADTVIRGILDIPDNYHVLCIIALGYPEDAKAPHDEDDLKWENVHVGKF